MGSIGKTNGVADGIATSKDVADVLIIGSGESAGPFAWHLNSLTDIKIVCLEQGDWVGPQESLAKTRRKVETSNPEAEDSGNASSTSRRGKA